MTFVIDGEGEFNASKIPKCVSDMVAALEAVEDGKLLRRRVLAGRVNKTEHTISGYTTHPALADFKFSHQRILYFGNKKTIAAARQQFKT